MSGSGRSGNIHTGLVGSVSGKSSSGIRSWCDRYPLLIAGFSESSRNMSVLWFNAAAVISPGNSASRIDTDTLTGRCVAVLAGGFAGIHNNSTQYTSSIKKESINPNRRPSINQQEEKT